MKKCQVPYGCIKEVELKRLNEPIYLTLSQRQNRRDSKERLAGAGGWRRGNSKGGGGSLGVCWN